MLADIGDLRVYYTETGTGPPVVLVHGIGADAHVWDEVLPHLAGRFHVYALDLRGFGRTVRPPAPRLSYDLWVDDVACFVERVAGGPVSLIGWSLGGAVGLNVALRYPQLLRALVLIGTPSPLRPPTDRSGFNERLRLAEAGASIEEIVNKTFQFTEAAYSSHTRASNPSAVERMRHTLLRNDPRSYVEMVEANRAKPDIAARLGEIRAPTLVLVGEDDARTPIEMSEDLNKSIPDSYLKILPRCGHFYPYERPEVTSRIVVDFLGRCGPR